MISSSISPAFAGEAERLLKTSGIYRIPLG